VANSCITGKKKYFFLKTHNFIYNIPQFIIYSVMERCTKLRDAICVKMGLHRVDLDLCKMYRK